ncbi:hypothetical protein AX16_010046 [Volvariella volvacea WC 439]|nr:hypothetical protein AX16_010046 [Volvariella volvacea WC 439]
MVNSVIEISSGPPTPSSGVSEALDEEVTFVHRRSERLERNVANSATESSTTTGGASRRGRRGAQKSTNGIGSGRKTRLRSKARISRRIPVQSVEVIELTDDEDEPNLGAASQPSLPSQSQTPPLSLPATNTRLRRRQPVEKQSRRSAFRSKSNEPDRSEAGSATSLASSIPPLVDEPARLGQGSKGEVVSAGSKRKRGVVEDEEGGTEVADPVEGRPRPRARRRRDKGKERAEDERGADIDTTPIQDPLNATHPSQPPRANPTRRPRRIRDKHSATLTDARGSKTPIPQREASEDEEAANNEKLEGPHVPPSANKGKGKARAVDFSSINNLAMASASTDQSDLQSDKMTQCLKTIFDIVSDVDEDFVRSMLAHCFLTYGDFEDATARVIELLLGQGEAALPMGNDVSGVDQDEYMDVDSPKAGSSGQVSRDEKGPERVDTTLADEEFARKLMEEEAAAQPAEEESTFECGCCCVDFSFDELVQCQEGHLFCKKCISTHASSQLLAPPPLRPPPGSSSTALRIALVTCLNFDPTAPCTAPFPSSELQRALAPAIYEKWEKESQKRELEAAGIDNLVECPFCDWRCVIEGPLDSGEGEAPVFRCARQEDGGCGAVSCMRCKAVDHRPKTCHELEQEKAAGSGRHTIEEAMTNALMRNCPKCRKPYIKEDGCNKMTCVSCRTLWCYICRKIIRGYDHFDSSNNPYGPGPSSSGKKCRLWDPKEKIHDEEVKDAYDKAIEEYKRNNPTEAVEDLKIDVPKTYTPPANRPPGVGPMAFGPMMGGIPFRAAPHPPPRPIPAIHHPLGLVLPRRQRRPANPPLLPPDDLNPFGRLAVPPPPIPPLPPLPPLPQAFFRALAAPAPAPPAPPPLIPQHPAPLQVAPAVPAQPAQRARRRRNAPLGFANIVPDNLHAGPVHNWPMPLPPPPPALQPFHQQLGANYPRARR